MSKVYAIPYYPVGSILEFDRAMDMTSIYGGKWELFGEGRMTIGINKSDSDFSTVGKTGGSKAHTQTLKELVAHTHRFGTDIGGVKHNLYMGAKVDASNNPANPGIGVPTSARMIYGERTNSTYIDATGESQPMNIMNPYIVVYRYRKVAD